MVVVWERGEKRGESSLRTGARLFADSPVRARVSGSVYILVETAKLNHLDVFDYLCVLSIEMSVGSGSSEPF